MPSSLDDPPQQLLHDIATLDAHACAIVRVLETAGHGRQPEAALQHQWAQRLAEAHQQAFGPIRQDLAAEGCTLPNLAPPFARAEFAALRSATFLSQVRATLHHCAHHLEATALATARLATSLGLHDLARQLHAWSRVWVGLERRLADTGSVPAHLHPFAA